MGKTRNLMRKAGDSIRNGANRFKKSVKQTLHELNHGDGTHTPHSIIGEGEGRYHVNAQYN